MGESFRSGTPGASERLISVVAARQHGVFARAQAMEAGFTDRMIWTRVEGGLWRRVHPGVYRVASVPPSWRSRAMAACLAGGSTAVSSYRSAGALWGLGGCAEGVIDVTLDAGGRRRLHGVSVHWTRAMSIADRGTVDGIPVTRPGRTLIDLATVLAAERLEEAVDSALRDGLVTIDHLERRLGDLGSRGRSGVGMLRAIVDDRRGGRPADSAAENRVRRALIAAGLPKPVRQYELRDDEGRHVATFDLALPPPVKIGIEFDSYRFHAAKHAWRRDQSRHNGATALGWLVFHLTADLDVAPVVHAYRSRAAA